MTTRYLLPLVCGLLLAGCVMNTLVGDGYRSSQFTPDQVADWLCRALRSQGYSARWTAEPSGGRTVHLEKAMAAGTISIEPGEWGLSSHGKPPGIYEYRVRTDVSIRSFGGARRAARVNRAAIERAFTDQDMGLFQRDLDRTIKVRWQLERDNISTNRGSKVSLTTAPKAAPFIKQLEAGGGDMSEAELNARRKLVRKMLDHVGRPEGWNSPID